LSSGLQTKSERMKLESQGGGKKKGNKQTVMKREREGRTKVKTRGQRENGAESGRRFTVPLFAQNADVAGGR